MPCRAVPCGAPGGHGHPSSPGPPHSGHPGTKPPSLCAPAPGRGNRSEPLLPTPLSPPKQHHHRDTAPTNRTLHLSKSLSGCAPFKLTPPGVSFFFLFPCLFFFYYYYFELFLFHFIFSILERRGSHRAAAFPSAGRRGCSGTARLGGTGAKEPTGLL